MDKQHALCVASLKLLGDFWTLRIIDALKSNELRFCELQRELDNMNPVTLTCRLKRLEENGLLDRREETLDKISVVYTLTDKGQAAIPVLRAYDKFAKTLLPNS